MISEDIATEKITHAIIQITIRFNEVEFSSAPESARELSLCSNTRNTILQIIIFKDPITTPTIVPIPHTHHGCSMHALRDITIGEMAAMTYSRPRSVIGVFD